MTSEEAVRFLGTLKAYEVPNGPRGQAYRDAIDMAIKALKNQPIRCKNCYWWDKYEDSAQGYCSLHHASPTGAWFCGNAIPKEAPE